MAKLILVSEFVAFQLKDVRRQLLSEGFSLNIKSKICEGPLSIISGMYGIS